MKLTSLDLMAPNAAEFIANDAHSDAATFRELISLADFCQMTIVKCHKQAGALASEAGV